MPEINSEELQNSTWTFLEDLETQFGPEENRSSNQTSLLNSLSIFHTFIPVEENKPDYDKTYLNAFFKVIPGLFKYASTNSNLIKEHLDLMEIKLVRVTDYCLSQSNHSTLSDYIKYDPDTFELKCLLEKSAMICCSYAHRYKPESSSIHTLQYFFKRAKIYLNQSKDKDNQIFSDAEFYQGMANVYNDYTTRNLGFPKFLRTFISSEANWCSIYAALYAVRSSFGGFMKHLTNAVGLSSPPPKNKTKETEHDENTALLSPDKPSFEHLKFD